MKGEHRAEEGLWLTEHAVLPDGPSSVPSTHISGRTTTYNSSFLHLHHNCLIPNGSNRKQEEQLFLSGFVRGKIVADILI